MGRDQGLVRVVGGEHLERRAGPGDDVCRDPVRGIERAEGLRLFVQQERRVVPDALVVQAPEDCAGLPVDVRGVLVRGAEREVTGDAFEDEDTVLFVGGHEGAGVPGSAQGVGHGPVGLEFPGEVGVVLARGLHGVAVVAGDDVQDPRVEQTPRVVRHQDRVGERPEHERDLVVIESGVAPLHGGTLPGPLCAPRPFWGLVGPSAPSDTDAAVRHRGSGAV